jgi:hypothetical protein
LTDVLLTVGIDNYAGKPKLFFIINFIIAVIFLSFLEMFLRNNLDFNMFITLSDADLIQSELTCSGRDESLLMPFLLLLFY